MQRQTIHEHHLAKLHFSHMFSSCCSKTLSQRVASYNQRVVAEGDALAEEVKTPRFCARSAFVPVALLCCVDAGWSVAASHAACCLLAGPLRHPLRKTSRLARFPLFVVYLAVLRALPIYTSATAVHLPVMAFFEWPPASGLPGVAAITALHRSSLRVACMNFPCSPPPKMPAGQHVAEGHCQGH